MKIKCDYKDAENQESHLVPFLIRPVDRDLKAMKKRKKKREKERST